MVNASLASFTIRLLSVQDLPVALQIQDAIFHDSAWTANDYVRLIQEPGGLALAAEKREADSGRLVGFLTARQVLDEAELLNMAVDPACQRLGIGRALLHEALRRLASMGAQKLYLEVRSSNQAALGLYYSEGFKLQSIRRSYYSNPREDACVLFCVVSKHGLLDERLLAEHQTAENRKL